MKQKRAYARVVSVGTERFALKFTNAFCDENNLKIGDTVVLTINLQQNSKPAIQLTKIDD